MTNQATRSLHHNIIHYIHITASKDILMLSNGFKKPSLISAIVVFPNFIKELPRWD